MNRPNETAPVDVAREVKKGQAFELRVAGANYREIAKALGVSVGSAHTYVTEALEELQNANAETVEKLRRMEITRLETIQRSLWTKKDQPRVADSLIRISERLSRLQGLDIGKTGDDAPPVAPLNFLPGSIQITLVSPETKAPAGETIAPAGGTIAPQQETTDG